MRNRIIASLATVLLLCISCSRQIGLSAKISVVKVDSCVSICNNLQFVFENNSDTDYFMSRISLYYHIFKNGVDVTDAFDDSEMKYYERHTQFSIDSVSKSSIIMDGSYRQGYNPDSYPYSNGSMYDILLQDIYREEEKQLLKLNKLDTLPNELKYIPEYNYSALFFLPKGKAVTYTTGVDNLLRTKGVYKIIFDYYQFNPDTIISIGQREIGETIYNINPNPRKVLLNKYHRFDGRLRADTLTIEVK